MIGYIYLSTNLINGKQYVGQSMNQRDKNNYIGSGTLLTRAIKRYGKENFRKIILRDNINCQSALNLFEQIYIKKYNTSNPTGYNLELGGNGRGKTSDETRGKLSIANKGKKKRTRTPEHCKNISKALKGKKMPEHLKENMRIIMTGKKLSEATKKKLSESHKGYVKTPEHLENISKALRGRKMTPEQVEKNRKARTGKKMSIEAKKKIGLYWKGRKRNPNQFKKSSETKN